MENAFWTIRVLVEDFRHVVSFCWKRYAHSVLTQTYKIRSSLSVEFNCFFTAQKQFVLFRCRLSFYSAYYSVYECTQANAGRCGGLSKAKFPLRQIYQGLEHNCRLFKPSCAISIKHPPPVYRPPGYIPGLGYSNKKVKPRPLPGGHSGHGTTTVTTARPTSSASCIQVSLMYTHFLVLCMLQLLLALTDKATMDRISWPPPKLGSSS